MASIGFLIEGALVNALAFTLSNYLFSSLSKESIDKGRNRHDKAIEDLQRAQIEWAKRRQERLDYINLRPSTGADLRPRNYSPHFHWRRSAPTRPCHDHATPFLTSLRLPALPWPRLGVNGLGMSRATILESGVVIRFEFFELQPFKVDQFFRGFFRYFPTLITPKYIQK